MYRVTTHLVNLRFVTDFQDGATCDYTSLARAEWGNAATFSDTVLVAVLSVTASVNLPQYGYGRMIKMPMRSYTTYNYVVIQPSPTGLWV